MCLTRDRNCPTDFALLPECAGNTRSHVLEQETVLDKVRGETRVRTCRSNKYRTFQSTRRDTRSHVSRQQISYFSEYAKRHEIARVETTDIVLLRVRGETRVRTCQRTKYRTCQSTRTDTSSHVSENQISYCTRSTRITRIARVNNQLCETARLCRQHDRR